MLTEDKPVAATLHATESLAPKYERALAARTDHIREEEREHLARELHDHFGQSLTALKLSLHRLLCKGVDDSVALERRVQALMGMCDSMIDDVRRVARTLRPSMLDEIGLAAAVEKETSEFGRRADIDCSIDIEGSVSRLERGQVTAIFRILQEALTNVARHANATRVSVMLRIGARNAHLRVSDNGSGFATDAPSDCRHLGLLSMRERAIALGGDTRISSSAHSGTRVAARIPIASQS